MPVGTDTFRRMTVADEVQQGPLLPLLSALLNKGLG